LSGGVSTENPTAAYLMPLLWILIAGVVARAISSGFEVAYPLRLVVGAIALLAYRRRFGRLNWQVSWRGAALGVAIFIAWEICARLLLPATNIPTQLAGQSIEFKTVWIACRIIAAVITVPLAEELAFRGFLMRRLMDADFESVPFSSVRPFAIVISAIVFGVSHGAMWPAGIATGLALGVLLVRRGSIGDVVLAHGTANALVAVAVLAGGQWQLW
jgi:CAAX prenyl protease-like protein